MRPLKTLGRRDVLPGWWLVALIGLIMAVSTGSISHAVPVWIAVLKEDFGWRISYVAPAIPILAVGGILLGPAVGYLGDRVIGIPKMVAAGLIILAGALFLFSRTQDLWMFYTAVVLMTVGATMSGWILLLTALSRWFVRRRATAIGFAYMFHPLGAMIFLPLIGFGMGLDSDQEGWRLTAVALGGFMLVVATLVFVLLRNRPEETGLRNFSAFQTLRTRAFWLVVLGEGLASMEILNRLDTTPLDTPLTTAAALAVFGLASLVSYPLGGLVGDRFSKSPALACFTALQVVAWAAMAFVGSSPAVYVSAIALGISRGGRGTLRVAILADYFGTVSLATILGLFGFFAGLMAVIGDPLAGRLYDTQGDAVGFLILAGLTLLAAFSFQGARPPQTP